MNDFDLAGLVTVSAAISIAALVALIAYRAGYQVAMKDASGRVRQRFQFEISKRRVERDLNARPD